MDHEKVILLIPELARGDLSGEEESEARRHVDGCADCRASFDFHRGVVEQVAEHGAALFGPCPPAAELVRYALKDGDLSTAELAALGSHVKACPSCSCEVEATRGARASSESWSRRLLEFVALPQQIPGWQALAPAVAAMILVFPAYLGIRHVTQPGPSTGTIEWSGAMIPSLLLQTPSRSGETSPSIPSIRLEPGQPYQSMTIDYDLSDESAGERIVVRLTRDGDEVWAHETTAADLGAGDSGSTTFLVPADRLRAGEYRLSLRAPASGTIYFSATFEIVD